MGAPGFDDAPAVELKVGEPKAVTLIVPYYENPMFLARQIEHWKGFKESTRHFFRVIVVDDGSPNNPAMEVLRAADLTGLNVRAFRIDVDVRWNWLAARNIGMHYAEEGWCLLTDIDHVVPENTLAALITEVHAPAIVYRLNRVEHTGQAIHPHPNTMFMTRAAFWKIGGYDEALSGCYGTDGDWRRRITRHFRVKTLAHRLVRYEYQGDSSTTKYLRKQPEDARKKSIIAKRDHRWRPLALSFPYHEEALRA